MGLVCLAFGGSRRVRSLLIALLAAAVVTLALGAGSANALTRGHIDEFTSGLDPHSAVRGIVAGPDGNLWFASQGSDVFSSTTLAPGIFRITPSAQIKEFTHGLLVGSRPTSIAFGAGGDLWFTDGGTTPAIGRITPQGIITEFVHGLNSGADPAAVTDGPDGNVWFTDVGTTPAIGRITAAGMITEFSQGLSSDSFPDSIARGADGNLWFTDNATPAIGEITPQGDITEFTQGLPSDADPVTITAGPDGDVWFADDNTPAIGKVTPSGAITEYGSYFASASVATVAKPLAKRPPHVPLGITAGPDGDLWFTDMSSDEIGLMTPEGQVTEFSSGLNTGARPTEITAGADGNLWFTDRGTTAAIGQVGTGEPVAMASVPHLSGVALTGNRLVCSASWADWGGLTPSSSLFSFDGFRWLRDGVALVGKVLSSYTPVGADVGHRLACAVTVTYPLPLLVTAVSSSQGLEIHAAPVLSSLRVKPASFELTGRRAAGRCQAVSNANRMDPHCARPIALIVGYRSSVAAKVTFTVDRLTGGRVVGGVCMTVTGANRARSHCTRVIDLPGSITHASTAGHNRVPFNGRIGGRRLTAGLYRLVAAPLGGQARSATFTLMP